jgi:DNA-binding HxlR family transcriptional regulator
VQTTQPVTVTYELTDKGRALEEAIAAVEAWAEKWVSGPAAADEVTSRTA